LKRYTAVLTTRDFLLRGDIGSPADMGDFLTRLRTVIRDHCARRPDDCVGFVVTFHPAPHCEHEV
jgi:hypothetical protein